MDVATERLIGQALALPPADRADLAALLFGSLDDEPDPDVEAAWSEEIARRIAAIDSGETQLIPWAEVQRRLSDA